MAAVRKVLEEEHDLITITQEDVDTGIANMNPEGQRSQRRLIGRKQDCDAVRVLGVTSKERSD